MVHVIPRSEWGAKPPTKTVYYVPLSQRHYYFAHYLGKEKSRKNRVAQLLSTQAFHQGSQRNWSDIGYNYVIDMDGRVYEGRGRNAVGAHCPNYNRSGIGVLFMMGEGEEPSVEAKVAFLALHADLEKAKGGRLLFRGHRDGKATECPGDEIYSWIRAGMPTPSAILPVEEEQTKEFNMGPVIMKGSAQQAYLTDGLTVKRWIKSGHTVQAMRLDGYRFVEGPEYTSILEPLPDGPPIN